MIAYTVQPPFKISLDRNAAKLILKEVLGVGVGGGGGGLGQGRDNP